MFAVDLPVTLVNGDHQGFGALLDLVAVSGECTGVEVVNLSDRSESDELDDDIDGLGQGAEVDNASNFCGEATERLHERHKEGGAWVREIEGLVGYILHHLKALAKIALDLQVHEDGADETSAHDVDVCGQSNREAVAQDDRADEYDHENLEAKNEHSGVIGVVDLLDIHIELLHDLPVEGFERHGVGIVTELQALFRLDDLFEVVLILLLLHLLERHLALNLGVLISILVVFASSMLSQKAFLKITPLSSSSIVVDGVLELLVINFGALILIELPEEEGSLGDVKSDVKRDVEFKDRLLAISDQEHNETS